ncbi:tRNA3(Ser)-specific nuclease WapA precursor (plasmid) [Pseudoalteromonas sp. THAF3]|uniref:SpvB/TcaC N-terminal domain-containing protein n=1 Tax=Pseudoalteromonas sp. THAF3 TaxID=2587843 RepID=UPI0012A9B261|nr:SpvB/TcaC N-terminal domain-containing protein [Pseudoalteromonas sp. THAF3]QFU06943.1 tRNA3(Ser)-specific nuclease WapA precursor [Pseudoalteromonas sp. THAF3]
MFKPLLYAIFTFFVMNAAVAAPSNPSNVVATVSNGNDITISWQSVIGATYYVREARVGSGSWINPKEYTGTSVTFVNISPNDYQYRVKACGSQGCSNWTYSNKVSILREPSKPSTVTASVKNLNDVVISWSSVSAAAYYIREAKVGAGSWIHPKTYTTTSVTFNGLAANTYQYRVKACNDLACSNWTYSNKIQVAGSPPTPANVSASVYDVNNVRVSWSSVTGASHYIREAQIGSGAWINPEQYTGTFATLNIVTPNEYRYRVKSCNRLGCSAWRYSNTVTVDRIPTAPSTVAAAVKNLSEVDVSWSSSSHAQFYIREAQVGSGAWSNAKEYTATSATYNIVTPEQYRYRVQACNSYGCSGWTYSDRITVEGVPVVPENVSAEVQNNSDVLVSWSATARTQYYIREAQVGAGDWHNPKEYSGTSATFSIVTANQYRYRVKACNSFGCSAWGYSNTIDVDGTPEAPKSVVAEVQNLLDVKVSWLSSEHTQHYIREVNVGSEGWGNSKQYTELSATYNITTPNQYSYRVKACNSFGCSAWSYSNNVTVDGVPEAPSEVSAQVKNLTEVHLSWSPTAHALHYIREVQVDTNEWKNPTEHTFTATILNISTPGDFRYRVKACTTMGCSNWTYSETVIVDGVSINPGVEAFWEQSEATETPDDQPFSDVQEITAEAVGTIAGQAAVNGGAASYTIPIKLPPGRAGMQPNVSLNYSSRSGNGIAGVGWGLSAGSSITRCAATVAQDGINHTPNYTANDKLCLDGQRLVIVSGNYGNSGAIYKTELDTFVRVKQTGSLTDEASFVAEYKSGRTAYFGQETSSKVIHANKSSAYSWLISYEHDATENNYIHYEYSSHGQGEQLLNTIYYTGTGAEELGDRKVVFEYESAANLYKRYIAGGYYFSTKRLKSISTEYGDAQVSSWSLSYSASLGTSRSLLDSIEYCSHISGTEKCLPSTEFDWSSKPAVYKPELLVTSDGTEIFGQGHFPEGFAEVTAFGDADGNGSRDWPRYFTNAEFDQVGVNPLQGTDCQFSSMLLSTTCLQGDFNNDGRTDRWSKENNILRIGYVSGEDTISLNWQDTGVELGHYTSTNRSEGDTLLSAADYNGDGWVDITVLRRISEEKRTLTVYKHTQNLQNPYTENESHELDSAIFNGYSIEPVGDMNGDGIPDFLKKKTRSVYMDSASSELLLTSTAANGAIQLQSYDVLFGADINGQSSAYGYWVDVNADGLPDWLGWVDGEVGANLTVKLNQGNGTFTEAQDIGVSVPSRRIPLYNAADRQSEYVLRPKFSDAFRIMDIDGDGRSEVIMPNSILVEGCIILVGRRQREQRHGEFTVCGDSVYTSYFPNEDSNERVAIQTKFDYSLYQYQALKFSQDATGSVSAHFVDTDLVGTPSYSSVMDATGNGLPDLVYKYGCRYYASGEYRNHKFFCYMRGANGERIEGPELVDKNLITYSYPSGTAGGSSAVADHQVRKVYFNRNYGATEPASIEKSDYHPHDLLLSVTNGLDKKEQWHYRPLSSDVVDGLYNNPKHNELNDTEHFYFSSSMYVVHTFTQSDGIGGNQHYTYQYRDAMFNNQGRGFMGFKSVIEKDLVRGLVTQTDFKQVFPLQGKPYRQATFLENDYTAGSLGGKSDHTNAISYTQFEWLVNTDNGNHVYLANKETITRDITQDATKLGSVVESIASIDAYGNVLESKKTSKDETGLVTVTTTRAYTPNTDTWWLNKLDTLKVETSEISERAVTDPYISLSDEQKKELDTKTTLTTNYSEYDNSRKPKKITVSGSSGTGSSTNIAYNSYGLPTSKTVSANVLAGGTWSSSERVVESITYTKDGTTEADDGYFPLKITNAKQHELYKHTDPATGFVTKTKVQLGDNVYQETINTLDGYQRPYSSKTSGQPKVYTVVTGPDTTHAPENAVVQITTLSAGKPTQKVYQDKLGRTLRVATQGFNSDDWVFTDTQYDALGRKVFESQPYYNGHSKYGVSYSEFDALGRPKSKVTQRSCGGMTTSYAYAGLTTDIEVKDECNSKLITMSRTYNTRDQLIETKDAEDGITRYAYNGQGLPIVIQDAKNNHITAKYNAFGRKTDVNDPNQGKSTFAYNGFGELQKETHSTDTSIIYTVDNLGRVIQRSATGEDTLTYTYDTADNGVGQLHKEVGNGVNRTYEYDAYGRPTGTLINGNNRSYRITTFYDGNYGRAKGLRYPNGLTLEYLYTDAGYLETIQNAASHYIFKKITGQDAFANVTEATLGNELTEITSYSAVDGAMTSKQIADGNNNLMFLNYEQYDGFGNIRKLGVTTGAVGEQHTFTETYTYDNLHRLKTNQVNGIKIGSYTYDAIGNLLSKSDYSNEYDYTSEGSGGPNAVKRVQRNSKWVSFSYDKRGNMLTGDGLSSATYNAMDKPTTLVKNGITSQFVYGPNHMRFKHTTNGRTTYYADKLYEEEVQAEETTWRAYIDNVAIVSQTNEQAVQIRYTHTDRLGSSRLFTNHNGDVLATRNYDPFGKPRLANGNSKPSARLGDIVDTTTYRGFTDHEHLDEQQLIHMNGRVYDYNLGRFMSVDPLIQEPGNSQSLNPYSYIMNNPLAGTDPTGYAAETVEMKEDDKLITMDDGNTYLDQGGDTLIKVDSVKLTGSNGSTATISMTNGQSSADLGSQEGISKESTNNRAMYAPTDSSLQANTNNNGSSEYSKDSSQQRTTDEQFVKNHNLKITISKGKISIGGTIYSLQQYQAEKFIAYLKKGFAGSFLVDGKSYSFDINLSYTMWEGNENISLTAIRGLPPENGGLFYRSNAGHGGTNINLWMDGMNVVNTSTHEFMHILGFGDTYRDTSSGSVSFTGHENDIMGSTSGSIQSYHLRTLINNYGGQ